jgi:hypothetical protein
MAWRYEMKRNCFAETRFVMHALPSEIAVLARSQSTFQ